MFGPLLDGSIVGQSGQREGNANANNVRGNTNGGTPAPGVGRFIYAIKLNSWLFSCFRGGDLDTSHVVS